MTNPKAAFAWIAIFSLVVQPGTPAEIFAVVVLGVFMLSTVIHILYAVAFSTPFVVRAYGRVQRYLHVVFAIFFAAAGVRLLAE